MPLGKAQPSKERTKNPNKTKKHTIKPPHHQKINPKPMKPDPNKQQESSVSRVIKKVINRKGNGGMFSPVCQTPSENAQSTSP